MSTGAESILSESVVSTLRYRSDLTPEAFARSVLSFSRRSEHQCPGLHYATLGNFLISPYLRSAYLCQSLDAPRITIWLHELEIPTAQVNRVVSFESLEQLKDYNEESRRAKTGGRLLFIQGFMPAEWLNHIGAKFGVDPEFYFRHLDFSTLLPQPSHFTMLTLPSAAFIVRLRIVSILSWNDPHPSHQQSTQQLRATCREHMTEYLKKVSRAQDVAASDSIVRRFSVHDKNHFSVEQLVSVYVRHYNGPGWIALIWFDQGRDLSFSTVGPWKDLQIQRSSHPSIQPVIQHRERMALKYAHATRTPTVGGPQMTSAPLSYGQSLRPEIMGADSFYALSELYDVAIASQASFFTLLSRQIKNATVESQLEDLRDALEILQDHKEYILESLESVKAGGRCDWPKAPQEFRAEATESQERLRRDLEHLLSCAERLACSCNNGIATIMNDAIFRQSVLALQETKATMKLSVLIFFFAPISLTTALFSMDVHEISNGNLSIWTWVVATIGVVAISLVFWKWEPIAWVISAVARVRTLNIPAWRGVRARK